MPLTIEARKVLKYQLVFHEAYRQFPYKDSTGNLTVGIGRNLTDRGISSDEALHLLNEDITYFESKLNGLMKFYKDLNEARKIVLVNMAFNMGMLGLSGFTRFILALESHDYQRAAREMLDSKWAEQVGQRAVDLAQIMVSGTVSVPMMESK